MSSVPFRHQRTARPWFLPRILFMDVLDFPGFLAQKLGIR